MTAKTRSEQRRRNVRKDRAPLEKRRGLIRRNKDKQSFIRKIKIDIKMSKHERHGENDTVVKNSVAPTMRESTMKHG